MFANVKLIGIPNQNSRNQDIYWIKELPIHVYLNLDKYILN